MALVEKFDSIVLGGGKAGKSLAMALGPAGHKVALIEKGQIGGSCINVACIPTKTMVASVGLLDKVKHAGDFGLHLQEPQVKIADIIERKRRVVKAMVDSHWHLFKNTPNLELIIGSGTFISPKEILVRSQDETERILTADRIFINTGSKTMIPAIPGLNNVPNLTSTSIMELSVLPSELAIIGGGYIALEFAQIFARLGSKVTVLLRGDRFLPNEDRDIADAVKEILEAEGIVFKQNLKFNSVQVLSDSRIKVTVSRDHENEELTVSHLLVAVGRVPNTKDLGLDAAGITTDEKGHISVNAKLETNVPGIWALGDCNGGPLFTHVSWDDYRIVKANVLAGATRSTEGRLVPYTLFIDPELGRVGLTEEQALKKGLDIIVAKIPAAKIPRAVTSGESRGLLKAVINKQSGHILGVSLLCHSAGEVMSVVQMAMLGKLHYTEVRDTIFTHPTMAESLNLLFAGI
ncbi:MAG: mercuric reductase [Candidatus Obscuribacterales bacterium]|nr:mercuric reductase [Candidatus Obscuribacterales bacterium]